MVYCEKRFYLWIKFPVMKTNYLLTLFLLVIIGLQTKAQTFSHKEVYDSDFTFTDGIYLTKDDFRLNKPIEKSRINSNLDPDDLTYFEHLVEQKTISIFDNVGSETTVDVSKIFGFCSSGTVYVLHNSTFSRVGIIGSICHFLGSKTVFNPIYSPYWGMYGRMPYTQSTTTEPQEYFLVFETGEIMEYTSDNLLIILKSDPALHDEFAELSRKKRNSKIFYYMRQYNDKHPLYIPVYE